ncbi:hypothetical protein BegalDRAFT_2683 [Beggiatoa alba B18LD]|uniref:Uncharacterized protein n=1 Tax=Beggiatoa alba B18LD TaxID=395493 RepID=I3CIT1_9GAMM|nr:hypothetical protein [Beggiatoa alba]EIJ43524.1 hypothetical protein BegalDRAFT_2683 [Beggiatoa alba B18LD]
MNRHNNLSSKIEDRVKLLEKFANHARKWFNGDYGNEEKEELKRLINRDLIVVRQAVIDAGTMQKITIAPPPVGGVILQSYRSI